MLVVKWLGWEGRYADTGYVGQFAGVGRAVLCWLFKITG